MIRHFDAEKENCAQSYNVYVTEIDHTSNPPQAVKYLSEQRLFFQRKFELLDYDKDGNQIIKTEVDFTEELEIRSESKEGIFIRKNTDDENGKELLSVAVDMNNRIHQIDEYWYDYKGRQIKARNWEEGNDSVIFYYYDSNDFLLKCCEYNNGVLSNQTEINRERNCDIYCNYNFYGKLLSVEKYYEHQNGFYDLVDEFDGTGSLIKSTKWIWDDYKLIQKVQTNGVGNKICEEYFEYDKKNRDIIQKKTDFIDGNKVKQTIREFEYL